MPLVHNKRDDDVGESGSPTILLGGGWFEMGSDEGAPAEAPKHSRFVEPFRMDRQLVTNHDFALFATATNYRTDAERAGSSWGFDGERFAEIRGLSWRVYASPERSRHPVVQVSWHDAAAYARWSGKRLPTEAEWEFAARSAAGGDTFSWLAGPDWTAHCGAARRWDDGPGTSPVGTFGSSNSLDDMVGNVWQWCDDDYCPDAYRNHIEGQCQSEGVSEGLKVRRGGAWNVQQRFRLRCSNRGAFLASRSAPNLGFRCAEDCA